MTGETLFRKITTARKTGLLRLARVTLDRAALTSLRKIYCFDPWHAASPLSARPYRRTVAAMINQLHPSCVVEVGCGLGSVLSLITAPNRCGYDLDEGVIRAAQLIRSRKISFKFGDLTNIREVEIDALILVNWIHEYSPQQLADWLQPLLPRIRYLLMDAIDPDNPLDYKYKHDFSFLAGKAERILEVRRPDEGRSFCLYEVGK